MSSTITDHNCLPLIRTLDCFFIPLHTNLSSATSTTLKSTPPLQHARTTSCPGKVLLV